MPPHSGTQEEAGVEVTKVAMKAPEVQDQGEAQEAEVEVADEDPVAQEPTLGGAIQSLKPKGNFCACSSTEETAQTPPYAIWFTLVAGELGREPLVAIITPLKNMCSVEDD